MVSRVFQVHQCTDHVDMQATTSYMNAYMYVASTRKRFCVATCCYLSDICSDVTADFVNSFLLYQRQICKVSYPRPLYAFLALSTLSGW